MPTPDQFQTTRGTIAVTFATSGTYSSVADLAGLTLVGIYAPAWAGGAGSVTVRADWDAAGTGYPVHDNAGAPLRFTPFAAGTYFSLPPAAMPAAAQYVRLQVGTAGTIASGVGTIILVGQA